MSDDMQSIVSVNDAAVQTGTMVARIEGWIEQGRLRMSTYDGERFVLLGAVKALVAEIPKGPEVAEDEDDSEEE